MARVQVPAMAGYTPPPLLPKGWYDADVVNAQVGTYGNIQQLLVNLVVEDPSGTLPQGKNISDFIRLEGYEAMKDGGEFVKGKLNSVLEATGNSFDDDGSFDPDDLIHTKVAVHLSHNTNPKTGETSEQVDRYRAPSA